MAKNKMKTCRAEGCDNKFTPSFSSLQKYCSSQCAYNERKKDKASQPKKNYIKPISDKRSKEMKIYEAKRIEFLSRKENQFCPVYPKLRTSQIHHKKGRIGSLYLDVNFWLAVSAEGHKWIEEHPIEAKERGWSLNRLDN